MRRGSSMGWKAGRRQPSGECLLRHHSVVSISLSHAAVTHDAGPAAGLPARAGLSHGRRLPLPHPPRYPALAGCLQASHRTTCRAGVQGRQELQRAAICRTAQRGTPCAAPGPASSSLPVPTPTPQSEGQPQQAPKEGCGCAERRQAGDAPAGCRSAGEPQPQQQAIPLNGEDLPSDEEVLVSWSAAKSEVG